MNPQPDYRVNLPEDVKQGLERLLIREMSLLREVGGDEVKPQREMYQRAYDLLKAGEYIGYGVR